jgi:hypothetical protein
MLQFPEAFRAGSTQCLAFFVCLGLKRHSLGSPRPIATTTNQAMLFPFFSQPAHVNFQIAASGNKRCPIFVLENRIFRRSNRAQQGWNLSQLL